MAATADEVVAEARSVLRGARFRAVVGDPSKGATVAAEKGMLRETGNLLFHFSLIAVLVGVALGSLFGYSGSVLVPEGRTFTNTLVAYDAFTPGARVDQSALQPFSFRLDDFSATYHPDGEPADFAAAVRYRPELDAPEQPATIKVNQPLTFGQTKVYLTGPRLRAALRRAGPGRPGPVRRPRPLHARGPAPSRCVRPARSRCRTSASRPRATAASRSSSRSAPR